MMLVFLYATSIMSSSSVLTTTLSNTPYSIAASTVHMNKGLPPRSAKFFLGMPFEFPRTGMTATVSGILYFYHPIDDQNREACLHCTQCNIYSRCPHYFLIILCISA